MANRCAESTFLVDAGNINKYYRFLALSEPHAVMKLVAFALGVSRGLFV
ncbi:MAG: hypothetical protein ACPGLY_07945 [Rubripirellula sp.]